MTAIIIDNQQLPYFYSGLILLAVFYNFFLFVEFKDKSLIYLDIFILTGGIFLLILNDYLVKAGAQHFLKMPKYFFPFFLFAALGSAAQYFSAFLKIRHSNTFFENILKWERNIFIAGAAASIIINSGFINDLGAFSAFILILTAVAAAIISFGHQNRRAVTFLAVWGLFFIGIILFLLNSIALLPSNVITSRSVYIGFLLTVLFSPAAFTVFISEERGKRNSEFAESTNSLKNSEQILIENSDSRSDEMNKINIMLMDRAIELGSINQITEKINSSLNLNDIIKHACEELVKIFPVNSAGIAMFDEYEDRLLAAGFHPDTNGEKDFVGREINFNDNAVFLDIIKSKKPVVLSKFSYGLKNISGDEIQLRRELENVLIVPVKSLMSVIGFIFLPATEPEYKFIKNDIDLANTIAAQVAGSVANARLYSRKEKALDIAEYDLEIGRQIQSGFFPETIDQIEGWELQSYFKAARQVSGDFYDVFNFNDSNRLVFVVADVCDKGVGAALFMVLFRSLIRAYSASETETTDIKSCIKNIILRLNNYIAETHGKSNMFASMFMGVLDPDDYTVYYINGGLDAPVILDRYGNIKSRLLPTGPAVGMFANMEFTVKTVELNPGEILFVFTDGTTDAKNSRQELFGEDALLRTIGSPWSSGFSMLFDLNSRLDKHIGSSNQFDDITQFTLRKKMYPEECVHTFIRKALIENLIDMRDFVEKAVLNCELDDEIVFAFKIAAEEICTNIINYGYDGTEAGLIKLEFILENNIAKLKISDYGKHFDPAKIKNPDLDAGWKERDVGGLGISLVRQLVDKIEYYKEKGGSNCIALEKMLNNNKF